jgi:hypothetical protein
VVNASPLDMGVWNIFCQKMKEKWSRAGYRFDDKAIAELISTYGLKANDNDMNLREIKPKP